MEQPIETREVTEKALDHAADLLLAQLPDQCGELVVNLRDEYKIPMWQLFCGILLAMHLEGRLSAFVLDPAWRDALKQKELTCARCKEVFKPRWIAQVYCSQKCGTLAELEQRPKEQITDPTDLKAKLAALTPDAEPVRLMTDDTSNIIDTSQPTAAELPTFMSDSGTNSGHKDVKAMA